MKVSWIPLWLKKTNERKNHHFLNRSGLSVCLCVCPHMSAVYCLLNPPVSDKNVFVTKYEHFLMWIRNSMLRYPKYTRRTESLTYDPTLYLIAHISYLLTDRLFWMWLFICVYGTSDRAIPRVRCVLPKCTLQIVTTFKQQHPIRAERRRRKVRRWEHPKTYPPECIFAPGRLWPS